VICLVSAGRNRGNAVLNVSGAFDASAAQLSLSGNAQLFCTTEVINELLLSGNALDE